MYTYYSLYSFCSSHEHRENAERFLISNMYLNSFKLKKIRIVGVDIEYYEKNCLLKGKKISTETSTSSLAPMLKQCVIDDDDEDRLMYAI